MTSQRGASPAVIVPLADEIDLTNSEQVYDRLCAAFGSGPEVIIADFTATWFCDCGSLRRLLTVQRRAAAQGSQLRLVIPPGSPVRRQGRVPAPASTRSWAPPMRATSTRFRPASPGTARRSTRSA